MSIGTDLSIIYKRELDRFAGEISSYANEADIWTTLGSQKNSPATLALHIVGNLMSYIGAELGDSGYIRDREREFSEKNISRPEILAKINECKNIIASVLEELEDRKMSEPYPGQLAPYLKGFTTQAFLMHLLWHLGWHLGQVYYHRLGISDQEGL